MFLYFSSFLQWKMHSLHAFFLQFFVFHDISKPAYLPKSWISPKITNTVFTSFVPDLVNMVEIRAHGLGILFLLLFDDFGLAAVFSICLSIRFKLFASSIWIEHELLNPVTLQISHTITELSTHSKDGSTLWNLCSGRYRVYGVVDSEMPSSTDVLPSSRSFTHAFYTPPVVSIKVELGIDPIINLSDSSDDDRCVLLEVDLSPQTPFASLGRLPSDF